MSNVPAFVPMNYLSQEFSVKIIFNTAIDKMYFNGRKANERPSYTTYTINVD